jgi:hypothetical protein
MSLPRKPPIERLTLSDRNTDAWLLKTHGVAWPWPCKYKHTKQANALTVDDIAGTDLWSTNPHDLLVRFDAIGLLWATEHETGESESIFQAHLLAKAMGISPRHARRILARWRRQDWIRGEDD